MKHVGTITLETERLILRKFELSDSRAMYNNWANDDEVTKYMSWTTHENEDLTKQLLNMWVKEYENINNYQWCIVLKETNEPIGSISLFNCKDDIKQIEFGYCISRRHWNKGYTSEALKAVIDLAFKIGYERIVGCHHKDNIASGKVMIKNGLTFFTETDGKTNKNEDCKILVYELKK